MHVHAQPSFVKASLDRDQKRISHALLQSKQKKAKKKAKKRKGGGGVCGELKKKGSLIDLRSELRYPLLVSFHALFFPLSSQRYPRCRPKKRNICEISIAN
jgi:hypothetical protein